MKTVFNEKIPEIAGMGLCASEYNPLTGGNLSAASLLADHPRTTYVRHYSRKQDIVRLNDLLRRADFTTERTFGSPIIERRNAVKVE
jgi:hypothetical protein